MSLIRWEPFEEELAAMREAMDRLEEAFFGPRRRWPTPVGVSFPVDMYETDENVIVEAALPGIKPEDVDVTITGDTLRIKGEAKAEREIRRENYIRQERRYGAFSRSISLPSGLETDKAEATFENGILKLTIPKAEAVKPKVIEVKVKK